MIGRNGLPERIQSRFTQEMTSVGDKARDVLTAPVRLVVEGSGAALPAWTTSGVRFMKRAAGSVSWESDGSSGPLSVKTRAQMEFDGNLEFEVEVRATQSTSLKDIRLEIPLARDVAKLHDGHGCERRAAARRPSSGSGTFRTTRTRRGSAT